MTGWRLRNRRLRELGESGLAKARRDGVRRKRLGAGQAHKQAANQAANQVLRAQCLEYWARLAGIREDVREFCALAGVRMQGNIRRSLRALALKLALDGWRPGKGSRGSALTRRSA